MFHHDIIAAVCQLEKGSFCIFSWFFKYIIRYSNFDTQSSVVEEIEKNEKYNVAAITTGLGYWFNPQVAVKTDFQFVKTKAENNFKTMFNAGIAVMF